MSASTRLQLRLAPGASWPGIVVAGTDRGEIDIAEIERRLAQASGAGKDTG